jgi:hypothetical protein
MIPLAFNPEPFVFILLSKNVKIKIYTSIFLSLAVREEHGLKVLRTGC